MPRIMTIWLPKWPVQRRLVEQPDRRRVPLLVCRREPRGVMTVVSWAWAGMRRTAARIPCGLSLAETLAAISLAHGSRACRVAEIDPDDPDADRMVLEGVARWCRRFSPIVAVEAGERPECIHVDIAGTASLFGGEEAVVRTAVWTLAARGLHARAAVADTPAAAWAASHHTAGPEGHAAGKARSTVRSRRRWWVVPAGEQASRLADLPVSAIRPGEDAVASLAELGVATIGQVLRLPRRSLVSRFGERLERRVAEFSGTRAEPLETIRDESFPRAECRLAAPAAALDAIASALEGLVVRCVTPLAARGLGVTALQVRLETVSMGPGLQDGPRPPVVIDVGLFRPSMSVRHLVDLVQLRLSRIRLPDEVESIAAEVVTAGAVTCRQKTLFGGRAEADATSVDRLLDRLSGRLGRRAVFEPKPVADIQPEHAWAPVPPSATASAGASSSAAAWRPAIRPIWLCPRPVRLEAVSVAPDGPPVRFRFGADSHRIVESHGPERIETAWWRGACVRRDYYVVETESGSRWWLFRRLHDGAWFLHGQFS